MIITSLRDDTRRHHGSRRGDGRHRQQHPASLRDDLSNNGAHLTTPAAGDGGYIYIGGKSLTEYDPTNPFDGSLISNADISYMTRIEVQGGGIIDAGNNTVSPPGARRTSTGTTRSPAISTRSTRSTQSMMFTIADSNLSDFSDAAVFVHPQALNALYRDWTG